MTNIQHLLKAQQTKALPKATIAGRSNAKSFILQNNSANLSVKIENENGGKLLQNKLIIIKTDDFAYTLSKVATLGH